MQKERVLMINQNTTETAVQRQGWREDGRVDIDAVRAGAHDINDAPAVFESLCDEVEQLREQNAKMRVLYGKKVASFIEQLDEAKAEIDRLCAFKGGV